MLNLDFDQISDFIKRPELSFDYKAVIRVCREAGFFDFALELAKVTIACFLSLTFIRERKSQSGI
jgi:hypothetical protein